MIDPKFIEEYLAWKQTKDYFPPRWTPQEWIDELLMSEAYAKMNALIDMLDNGLDDIDEIKKFLNEPLNKEEFYED